MNAKVNHLQLNIDYKNAQFYKDLMVFLGWKVIGEWGDIMGWQGEGEVSLWFSQSKNETKNDRDGQGLNHVGLKVKAISDVDKAANYLKEQGVELLYGTPQHRPDFTHSEDTTYYQVMFDSPDNILFEIMYTGPK